MGGKQIRSEQEEVSKRALQKRKRRKKPFQNPSDRIPSKRSCHQTPNKYLTEAANLAQNVLQIRELTRDVERRLFL